VGPFCRPGNPEHPEIIWPKLAGAPFSGGGKSAPHCGPRMAYPAVPEPVLLGQILSPLLSECPSKVPPPSEPREKNEFSKTVPPPRGLEKTRPPRVKSFF